MFGSEAMKRRLAFSAFKVVQYETNISVSYKRKRSGMGKSYLADDEYAMIGTINLDYRSLVHHFENGVWMYRCEAIGALKKDVEAAFEKSIRITPDMMKTNLIQRFIRAVVRIFAPML
ncbi:MAG: phospholipase D-like domain-containing protein [Acutalibacteraceae bacterium]